MNPGQIIVDAIVRADALQEARIVDDTCIFVWRPGCYEQIEAALAEAGYRIVSTPVHPEPDAVQQRYVTDEPMITWTEADHELMRKACEEYMAPHQDPPRFVEDPSRPGYLRRCHNPHGLVAFYTGTP